MNDALQSTTKRLVHRVASQVLKQSKTPITNAPGYSVVWGVVDSINTGSTPNTLGVKLQGSSTARTGIKFLSSYSPTVGDTVVCSKYGSDLVVLGGMRGVTNPETIRISQTYSVQGLIAVPSGATNFLPPFFMPVPSGQSVKFVGVRAKVRSATSCTLSVDQNGSGITGLTALVVTTTATTTAPTSVTSVSDGDAFSIVVASISGTPDGLSVSFYFDVTP